MIYLYQDKGKTNNKTHKQVKHESEVINMIYNPFTDTVFTITWEDNTEEEYTSYSDYQYRLYELENWGYIKNKDFF